MQGGYTSDLSLQLSIFRSEILHVEFVQSFNINGTEKKIAPDFFQRSLYSRLRLTKYQLGGPLVQIGLTEKLPDLVMRLVEKMRGKKFFGKKNWGKNFEFILLF